MSIIPTPSAAVNATGDHRAWRRYLDAEYNGSMSKPLYVASFVVIVARRFSVNPKRRQARTASCNVRQSTMVRSYFSIADWAGSVNIFPRMSGKPSPKTSSFEITMRHRRLAAKEICR
jgi:hypothetical protein